MLMNDNQYLAVIEEIKAEIERARYRAAVSLNRELVMLYYHIGEVINEHKSNSPFRMRRVIPSAI